MSADPHQYPENGREVVVQPIGTKGRKDSAGRMSLKGKSDEYKKGERLFDPTTEALGWLLKHDRIAHSRLRRICYRCCAGLFAPGGEHLETFVDDFLDRFIAKAIWRHGTCHAAAASGAFKFIGPACRNELISCIRKAKTKRALKPVALRLAPIGSPPEGMANAIEDGLLLKLADAGRISGFSTVTPEELRAAFELHRSEFQQLLGPRLFLALHALIDAYPMDGGGGRREAQRETTSVISTALRITARQAERVKKQLHEVFARELRKDSKDNLPTRHLRDTLLSGNYRPFPIKTRPDGYGPDEDESNSGWED